LNQIRGHKFVAGRTVCRRNGFLRARTATCSARSVVQLQHIVRKILSPTHSGNTPKGNTPKGNPPTERKCSRAFSPCAHALQRSEPLQIPARHQVLGMDTGSFDRDAFRRLWPVSESSGPCRFVVVGRIFEALGVAVYSGREKGFLKPT
jgi:hypothetical protein